MNKKIAIVLVVILIVIGAGLAAFWPFRDGNVLRLPGIVEIQEVRLGSKLGGRVAKILVNEGDIVSPGQAVVVFETPELENQKRQMQARVDAAEADWLRMKNGARVEEKAAARAAADSAKARYAKMKNGWREEEKSQAISEWKTAKADHEQSLSEWTRVSQLYRDRSASRTEYDAALAYRDRAKGRVDAARAKMEMLERGSRKEDKAEMKAEWERAYARFKELDNGSRLEDIALARAKLDETKRKVEEIDINLREATVIVPEKFGRAVVEVLAVRPGDLVPPNQPVARVLRAEDLWVKIFVPETKYGLVTLGKKVEVTVDSHPGVRFQGVVMQRSNISEFTPRNVQSVDERRHQVFAVKIQVADPQGVFNAGMAAEVSIPLD